MHFARFPLTSSFLNSLLFLMHAKLVVTNFSGIKERESAIIFPPFCLSLKLGTISTFTHRQKPTCRCSTDIGKYDFSYQNIRRI